jgi:DNA primase large subunit
METLVFAQKFPFTNKARQFLKEENISISDVGETEIKRAALMISRAFSGAGYDIDIVNVNEEIYKKEIIAYPVAKLLISSMQIPNIIEKFANFIRKKTFDEIVNDSKSKELCLELADELGVKYDLEEDFFVSLPLLWYLKIHFIDEETKLINKNVVGGKVYLNLNDFSRYLGELSYSIVFDSLPIEKELIPKNFIKLSKSISSQLVNIQQKNFDAKIMGKMDPSLFPPSMKNLYDRALAGEKLTYYERLTIGGFLQQVGISKPEMMIFFSKSPDYKKHIAQYHVDRIFEKELSAPSYKKMDEFGIIVDKEEKKYIHPVRYYNSKMIIRNRQKNSEKNKKFGGEKDV